MGRILNGMYRAWLAAATVLLIAIPIGGVGAWAFNPDTGHVVHSETLWRIFGIMAEGGIFLLMALVVLLAIAAVVRKIRTVGRPGRA